MLSRAPDVVVMHDPRVRAIPVVDDGDRLVDLQVAGRDVVAWDGREDDGTGAGRLLRRGVRDRLARAADLLDPTYVLVLNEGWRPRALQERYFAAQVERVTRDYPECPDEWERLASRFVAPPDVAPHPTGAAVDVLLRRVDGAEVDLGCPIDTNPEDSAGLCFTDHPDVPIHARAARDALGAALRGAGFVNYPTEWWHWSYGDRYWALVTGATAARYGPVAPAEPMRL